MLILLKNDLKHMKKVLKGWKKNRMKESRLLKINYNYQKRLLNTLKKLSKSRIKKINLTVLIVKFVNLSSNKKENWKSILELNIPKHWHVNIVTKALIKAGNWRLTWKLMNKQKALNVIVVTNLLFSNGV